MNEYVSLLLGLVVLSFSGESILRGSVSLARRLGLSDLLVSAVVIGFGTSLPELTVSLGAALSGSPDIALGNVIGSNTANILLICGAAALLAPIPLKGLSLSRDMMMLGVSAVILVALMALDALSRPSGIVMVLLLVAYLTWSYFQDKKKMAAQAATEQGPASDEKIYTLPIACLLSFIGLVGLVIGAQFFVDGAVVIARTFGISEAVIGLTLVAVGTSLPELATAFMASLKKQGDLVIGNVLGSNVFNTLCILGITTIVTPIPVAPQMMALDIWVMLGATLLFLIVLGTRATICRLVGGLLLLAYVGYYAWLFLVS